ncbi:MAG: hypothetical protein G3M70_07960 [Candidatus Nitronauta litoralis]|uniref:Response regulatory domain-containing protein n=1 Tax=Candidatus Nitronauta litoralis TaxID=2705533 RepID=A0A7T0G0G4_9BACT|nr:MAG: hypothetical protein G3M70_07960 [Candidatus Nitronauta litoralis]
MPSHLKDFIVFEEDDEKFHLLTSAFNNSGIESRPKRVGNLNELQAILEQPEKSGLAHFKPRLVFIGMPKTTDKIWEFLELRRKRVDLRKIPMIVFSNPEIEHEETQRFYDYGVNSLVLRPENQGDYDKLIETIREYWFGIVMLPSSE